MKVVVDKPRCVGHARCFAVASEIFSLDEDGYIAAGEFPVPPGTERLAQRGVRACPERIITIVDDGD